MQRKRQDAQKGFTLVELIVVIAILGILTALVVPNVTGYVAKAQETTNQTNAQMIYTAAQLYITDKDIAGTPVTGITLDDLVKEGYLQKGVDGTANFQIKTTDGKTMVALTYQPNKPKGAEAISLGK